MPISAECQRISEILIETADQLARAHNLLGVFGLAVRANPPDAVSKSLSELVSTTEERLGEGRTSLEAAIFWTQRLVAEQSVKSDRNEI